MEIKIKGQYDYQNKMNKVNAKITKKQNELKALVDERMEIEKAMNKYLRS